MEQLSRIERRLQSLKDLDELVRALRSMAAVRAREAQEAFKGTRAYQAIIDRAIAGVSQVVSAPVRVSAQVPQQGRSILVVVTSENGFVGGFNNHLIDRALEVRQSDEVLLIVGRRGQIAAAERGIAGDEYIQMTSRVAGVTPLARRIGARLSDIAAARIVFARYRSGAEFDVEVSQILPLPPPADDAAASRLPPILQVPPRELLVELRSEYLFAAIADALMESVASENGARLRTMDAASQSITDKLGKLKRQERMARQEETTSDMLDVVTGAEAVRHG